MILFDEISMDQVNKTINKLVGQAAICTVFVHNSVAFMTLNSSVYLFFKNKNINCKIVAIETHIVRILFYPIFPDINLFNKTFNFIVRSKNIAIFSLKRSTLWLPCLP